MKFIYYKLFDNYYIENDDKALLQIFILYKYNLISEAKRNGMLSSLRKKTLTTYKNTYHCTINDEWYNNEPFIDILDDVIIRAKLDDPYITMEEMLIYMNNYFSANKNYCLNKIYGLFIYPVIQNINTEYMNKALVSLGINSATTNDDYDDYECHGYCCDDCDGDYDEYKRSQYDYRIIQDNNKQINLLVTNILDKYWDFRSSHISRWK